MENKIQLSMYPGALVRLSSADAGRQCADEDIRGWQVVDADGVRIGEVQDLLIDEVRSKVCFLEVEGQELVKGKRRSYLIPLDIVGTVTNDCAVLALTRQELRRAPLVTSEAVDEKTLGDVCSFFGSVPFWSPEYRDPRFGRYYVI